MRVQFEQESKEAGERASLFVPRLQRLGGEGGGGERPLQLTQDGREVAVCVCVHCVKLP